MIPDATAALDDRHAAMSTAMHEGSDARLHARVLAYVRARTEAGGSATNLALQKQLKAGHGSVRAALAALAAKGAIVNVGARAGWVVPAVAAGDVTLRTLLTRAKEYVNDSHAAASGPRTRGRQGADRRVSQLSRSQFAKAKTAAALAAELCSPSNDRTALGSVTLRDLAWNTAAGEWEIVPRLREWSSARPGASATATAAHVEGITLLLDLAATQGWLTRAEVHVEDFAIHAAEWEPWIEAATRTLGIDSMSRSASSRVRVGVRELATTATRLQLSPSGQIDWSSIADAITVEYRTAAPKRRTRLAFAAAMFNRLVRAGNIAAPLLGGRRAEGRRDGLVSTSVIRASIAAGDWSGWHDANGTPYRALLDGDFSLRRFIEWLDVRVPASALRERRLPERMPAHSSDISGQRRAIRKRKAGIAWFERRPSSLAKRLAQMNVLVGFAREALEIDWTEEDASPLTLVSPDVARKYAERWARERGMDPVGIEATQLASVTQALAHFASPFASGVARLNGNEALAETLVTQHNALIVLSEEFAPMADRRMQLREKLSVWTDGDPERADARLAQLETFLTNRVVALADNLDLAQQVRAVESCRLPVRHLRRWSSAVRDAAALAVWRRIPMRGKNLATLHLNEDWKASGEHPWQGSLRVCITDRTRLKTRQSFRAWLIKRAGDPDAERLVPRLLLQLYLMPGGAREQLLTTRSGRVPSPYVFVSDATLPGRANGAGHRERDGLPWRSCSDAFERWLRRYGADLGIDLERLPRGAKRGHILRHLAATLWESRGLPEYARALLGHASARDTAGAHYVSSDAHDLAPEDAIRQSRRPIPRAHDGTPSNSAATRMDGEPQSTETTDDTTSSEGWPECHYCFETLRVRAGQVARKCHACGEWQPGHVDAFGGEGRALQSVA